MEQNNTYKCLKNNVFSNGRYSLVPIRYQDRMDIMQWRNEQIYHLRQSKPLTETDQNNYFNNVVAKLFEQQQPNQILFSYLENGKCIGYGGLVHINWIDKNAEISFIIDTDLEKEFFHKHWEIYLDLLEQAAFAELALHKIYTYAFDLRPHLYEAIENKGYQKEAILKEHCYFNGEFKDVVIHSKINNFLLLRKIVDSDKELIFDWANDKTTRENSFNPQIIDFETHSAWFDKKIKDENALYFIGEINSQPVGIVRFDKENENSALVGISIDKNFRGRGLSTALLQQACAEYFKLTEQKNIIAQIKEDNIASIKSFLKAGFVFDKTLKINNMNANQYKLSRA